MRDLWKRLEAFLKVNSPATLDFLNPPATKREIRDAEAELGIQFPIDFAESLRIHNGQRDESGEIPLSIPLVPAEYEQGGIYRATFGELAPLSWVVHCTKEFRANNVWQNHADSFEYEGPVRRDGKWDWLIFVSAGTGDHLGLDLNPAEGGQIGQVLSIIHDPSCLLVLAPRYRAWFETLVERYESGRYMVAEDHGIPESLDSFKRKKRQRAEDDDGNILRFSR